MLENKEIELASGKKLSIGIASFGNGVQLAQTILKCLKNSGFKIDQKDFLNLNFDELFSSPFFLDIIAKTFLEAFTDEMVDKIFWEMAKKCTYDGLRVTEELFNNSVDARGDFYQIKFSIIKENIMPFFPHLHITSEEKK